MRARVVTNVAALVVLVALVGGLAACSSPDDSTAPPTTAPATTAPSTTSTTVVTTSTAAPTTTLPPTTPSPTAVPTTAGLTPPPGSPCALGSSPDCIDPLRTGQGVYLIGGADCMATSPDPALCMDLDGDGIAGYPDHG